MDVVIGHGDRKSSVRLRNGLRVDLMVLPPEDYGALLHHFTGSREHNIQMRDRALNQGLKLNEYGFTRPDGSHLACPEEVDVFRTLGLPWIAPELREGTGEIAAAAAGRLPHLVTADDIRGDLHNHSVWSDGTATIAEMARAARDRGYAYMALTDHTQSLTIARGLTVEQLWEQAREVAAVNAALAPFRVLHGVELEIRPDGTLDYPDEVLARLDIVVAAVHQGLRQDADRITERVLRACRNPHVDIIAHPTGQLLTGRAPSALDVDALIAEARRTGTVLEINASPERLDLDDVYARRAIEAGVLLAVDTDSHHPEGFANLTYGLAVARRAWAEPSDILNTRPLDRLAGLAGGAGRLTRPAPPEDHRWISLPICPPSPAPDRPAAAPSPAAPAPDPPAAVPAAPPLPWPADSASPTADPWPLPAIWWTLGADGE